MARITGLPYCCGIGVLGDFGEEIETSPEAALKLLEQEKYAVIVATTSRGHHHGGGPQLTIEEFLTEHGFEVAKKFRNFKITGNEVTLWVKVLKGASLEDESPEDDYDYYDDDPEDEDLPF